MGVGMGYMVDDCIKVGGCDCDLYEVGFVVVLVGFELCCNWVK